MGSDSCIRHTMHLMGTDLHLHAVTMGAYDRRMQRLVHIPLGHGDIILETPWNRLPGRMDHPQHLVALPHVIHQDAESDQVIDLLELHITLLHLAIDGIQMFTAARNLILNAMDGQFFRNDGLGLLYEGLPFLFFERYLSGEIKIYLWIQIPERQIF